LPQICSSTPEAQNCPTELKPLNIGDFWAILGNFGSSHLCALCVLCGERFVAFAGLCVTGFTMGLATAGFPITRSPGVPGKPDFGLLGCRSPGVPGKPDFGLLGCRSPGVPGKPDFGLLGCRSPGVPGKPDFGLLGCRSPDLPISRSFLSGFTTTCPSKRRSTDCRFGNCCRHSAMCATYS